jgi:hypothetical protein
MSPAGKPTDSGERDMGLGNIGAGATNITINNIGGPLANLQAGADPQNFQPRFDNLKAQLDANKGDSEALKGLRDLKKDVDSAVSKEAAKENADVKQQEMMEALLGMIMQLLRQILGGDEDEKGGGGGGGGGGCSRKGKPEQRKEGKPEQSATGSVTITISV